MMHIKSKDEFDQILKDYEIVIIKFSADWCGPCRKLGTKINAGFVPHIKDMKNVILVEIDTSALPEFVDLYSITGIPTVMIYKNGEVHRFMLKNRDGIKEETNKIIGNRSDISIPKILCKIVDELQMQS